MIGNLSIRIALLLAVCAAAGCNSSKQNDAAEAPPPAQVVQAGSASLVRVEHPQQFPLTAATSYSAASTLNVTGTVTPDVTLTVPVITMASGRVVGLYAKLGDAVKKGQLLMRVSSDDITSGYSAYRKAVADEKLSKEQLVRAQLLCDKGAIPKSQLELAEDTEQKAVVDVQTSAEHLKLFGVRDMNAPDQATVNVYAPISGVLISQNVTDASAAGNSLTGSPNAFTIADLSRVWILCDVYENDLAKVHVGQQADVHVSSFPDKMFKGTISDIGAVLDANTHTAKVRIVVPNPGGILRVGMFATATFHGSTEHTYAQVPATAVLHLHDRDWVYVPTGGAEFRRVSVQAGDMLPNNMQAIVSGLAPGQQVVTNALELENTVEP
jgi:cobalt-zinc-cadmium efflux system membrane fusion protein